MLKNTKNNKNKKDNLIKLGELSLAGAALASLNVNTTSQKHVKASGNKIENDSTKNTQTLDTSALSRMMKVNTSSDSKQSSAKANVRSLAENKATVTDANADNGGFDSSWGTLNVKDWQGEVEGDYFVLTKYTGDPQHIIVPNAADFKKAGVDIQGKQVGIKSGTLEAVGENWTKGSSIAFSNTNGQKIKAVNSDWEYEFMSNQDQILSRFNGIGLDTSNITNMDEMFADSHLEELDGVENWDVSHVTNMSEMFELTDLTDLSGLSNWNVSNVTNMSSMFSSDRIKNLVPLKNWDVSNVTDMDAMFSDNQIKDLTPIKNWNTSNVNNMQRMFYDNQIPDLSGLVNWNVSNVTNISEMFCNNQISDLSGLANWNTRNVKTLDNLFSNNSLKDVTPIKNWNTSNVEDFRCVFASNPIRKADFSKWDFRKVQQVPEDANQSGMSAIIDPDDYHCIVYLGDNDELPSWFMNPTVPDPDDEGETLSNDNIFTSSDGGVIILTSNPKLLANPNKDFNKISFTDANDIPQDVNIPVFINSTFDKIAQDTASMRDNAIAKFKQEHTDNNYVYRNSKKVFYDTDHEADYDDSDPVDRLNVNYKIGDRLKVNINFKNYETDDDIGDYSKTLTEPDDDGPIDYSSLNDTIKKLQQAGFETGIFDKYNPSKIIPNWGVDEIWNAIAKNNSIDDECFDLYTGGFDQETGGYITLDYRLKHKHVTVTHDNPKSTSDIIDGTNKYYPAGVTASDLVKTKEIPVTFYDKNTGAVIGHSTVRITKYRDADVDAVTGDVNYTDWKTVTNTAQITAPDTYTLDPDTPVKSDIRNAQLQFDIDKQNPNQGTLTFLGSTKYITSLKVTCVGQDVPATILVVDNQGHKLSHYSATTHGKVGTSVLWDGTYTALKVRSIVLQMKKDGYDSNIDISNLSQFANVKFTNNDNPVVTIIATPRMIKVTHDQPKTVMDMIDGNNSKHYPAGVGYSDLNQYVNRKITFVDPNGNVVHDPITQGVHMYRDATFNMVTNAITYTDWTSDKGFDAVTVPDVTGYTPDKTTINAVAKPEIGKDYNESVVYTHNVVSAVINYVDDTTGKTLRTDTIQAGVGSAIKSDTSDYIKQLESQGYVLVSNNYKDGATAQADPTKNNFTVHVKQGTVKVAHDAPKTPDDTIEGTTQKFPAGVGQDDLNKIITRTITFKDPDGKDVAKTITQTIKAHRDAVVNIVTGDITYTDWVVDGSFDSVPVPPVTGYTPDKTNVPKVDKPQVGQKYNTNVVYTRSDENATITFVDDTTNQTLNTETAKAKYGDVIQFKVTPSDYIKELQDQGYELVSNNFKDDAKMSEDASKNTFAVHVKQRTVKVAHDAPKTTNDVIDGSTKKYPQGVGQDDLNKTITRTIVLKDENGKPVGKNIVQTVKAHRDAVVNVVTGKITYTPWTAEGSFDSVDVPKIDGYTPDKNLIPKVDNPVPDKDYNTSVVYTHNNESASITYIDDTTGKVLKSESVQPKFGDVIKFATTPSDYIKQLQSQGYVLVSNNYKDGATAQTDPDKNKFTVHVKQGTVKVTHDAPKTTDDVIDGTLKKYPKGVGQDDLNKSITRTIIFKDPNGKDVAKTITRTIKAHRDATVNIVTGDVTYTDWVVDGSFDSVPVPPVTGYTPDKTTVPKVEKPQVGQKYDTNVVYTRNDANAAITFVDDTTSQTLNTETAKAKYGDIIKFKVTPNDYIKQLQDKGYELVSNDFKDDAKMSENASKNVFAVHVKQRTVKVMHDQPKTTNDVIDGSTKKYPQGVGQDDLNKQITRTIVLKDENGKHVGKNIVQTVKVHRDAVVNVVTGKVTYTPWTADGSFDNVDVPKFDGYTPDKNSIPKVDNPQPDKDYNTSVVYTHNNESASITYIDDTTGKVLNSETAQRRFGDVITFKINPSDYIKQLENKGYELVSNNYKDGVTTGNAFTVHMKHHMDKVERNKDVHEHINYTVTDKNGKTVSEGSQSNPVLHFDQTGIKDAVTGNTTWTGKLDSQTFSSVDVAQKPGYVADIKTVPAKTVTITNGNWDKSHDINTTVNYTPAEETVKMVVKDEQGNVIKTIVKHGKYGSSYDFSNEKPEISGYTFEKASDNVKGKFDVKNADILLTYKKNEPKKPETPAQPTHPKKPTKPAHVPNDTSVFSKNMEQQRVGNDTSVFKQNIAEQQDNDLPEMAESKQDMSAVALGLTTLTGLVGLSGAGLMKRKRENHE